MWFLKRFVMFTIFVSGVVIITVCLAAKDVPTNKFVESVPINETELPCSALLSSNKNSSILTAAEKWKIPNNYHYSDSHLARSIKNSCDNFLHKKKYFLNLSQTEDEKDFSIAFSIVAFKTASQVERLLRTIYRPWNYYCIHIDKKANKEFVSAINELVECLNKKHNNIINTANRVDVKWGKMSVLEADLNCMKELYDKYKKWKYLINLTGQEFPLKTNAELVKILKAYKGANNLEGTYTRRNEDRISRVKLPFPVSIDLKLNYIRIEHCKKYLAFIKVDNLNL